MSNILQGLNETQAHDGAFLLTESRTYKLWESAGQKIVEAQLTADQINQIFKQVEQGATAAGGNRTMLGKGKDAAGAVKKAYDDLVSKVQNSGPIKGVDAMYDKAAEKLKQATGGDQGVMKYVQKYRDFAKKNPVAQSLIYSALIAAAGISGVGVGGAAALGLFKMVDKLLQGEKFSTAVGKGATTGALAYGASQIGQAMQGTPQGATPDVTSPTASSSVASSGVTGDMGYDQAFNTYIQKFAQDPKNPSAMIIQQAKQFAASKAKVNESIELTESQIFVVFGKIANRKVNEGIMDTLKGAAGKAADWAQTKGTNLTTKVTADKLLQAWKKAGSPTDSLDVASIIQKAGVPSASIKQVYGTMKIPFAGEKGAGADTARKIDADPSSVAPGAPTTPASTPSANAPSADTAQVEPSGSFAQVQELIAKLDAETKEKVISTLKQELTVAESHVNELSNNKLSQYKTAAGAAAKKADSEGNYKHGDKRMSGIVRATKKQFANDNKGLKEDFEDMPDELMDPAVWKKATLKQKYKAVVDAGLIEKPYRSSHIGWMNDEINPITGELYNNSDMPYALKNGELDLNKVYRNALAKYQDRKHSSDLTSQDREHELTIGTAGRAEMIRKVDELAEMKRVTLRNERLQDEQVAFQRAETIQQRKDEMKKIADKYQHDLTVIDKEHRNNMESIRTGNNHEIKKIDKEHDEARREREHSSSESDKDRAEREREREQNRPKPEKPKPVDMPEPEQEPEDNRGNNFDQDTGEPIRPQSNQWHTSQQVGYKPSKPSKDNDDVTDVELKPNKPLALGNSVKEAGPGVPFRGVGGAFNRGDDERHDLDTPKQKAEIWGLKINGKVWSKDGKYVTFPSREAALIRRNSLLRTNPNLEIGLVTQGGSTTASAAPTKPAPQKPLMAVSFDRWKQNVLAKYPEARFMTQKMINGATIASDRSGQVGVYDPKNSYARVGPETKNVAESGYIGGHNRDDPNYSGIDNVPKRIRVRKGSKVMAIPPSALEQFKADGWTEVEQDVAEAKADPTGSWVVYNGSKVVRFKTHNGAKAYAEKNGGQVASSEYYHDKIAKKDVAEEQLDELSCWPGHHRVAGTKAGAPGSCEKNKTNESEHSESCPHCGGEMVSEELMNEKKDACYYKVKSRYKVWPSAYASGALVKCRNKGASNWGNGGKKNEGSILEGINRADESLHDWFNKEKWVRMDTKGNIKGPCAKEPGEGKPKCLPQAKAHSLGKKGRASAAARKRREDPNPERSGKAINVNTKKQSNENVDESWKQKLGAAALTGAMALGAAGANARVTPGDDPNINRLTGKPNITQPVQTQTPTKAEAPKGFSKEYLQSVVNGTHPRPMISVEKAQELLKQGQ